MINSKLAHLLPLSSNIKQGILYGASIALMKGVSLLMLPFIANHLSAEQFGRLEVISTVALLGSILVGMGLEDTLFRFAGIEKSSAKRHRCAAQIFTLTFLIAIVTLIGSWYCAPLLAHFFPSHVTVYELRLVLTVLALEGCIAIPLGWLRMNNRATAFFITTTGRALIQALLVGLFLSLDRGVSGILEAGLVAALLQTILLTFLQLRDTGFAFSIKTYQRALIYSLPIVASGLVAFALNGMDRWVLAEYAGLTDVAQFAIAAKFALAMVLLMQPFGMWWSPRRFAVLNGVNGKQKAVQYIVLGTLVAIMIAIVVALLSPALIHWLLPQSYQSAAQYVVAIVLLMLLKELVELFNIGCFNGNTTSSQLFINLFATFLGICLMFLLTPEYKVWGIICSLLVAQSTRLILFYQISQYFLRLHYPIVSLLILGFVSSVWLVLGSQLHSLAVSILMTICAISTTLLLAHQLKLLPLPKQLTVKMVSL